MVLNSLKMILGMLEEAKPSSKPRNLDIELVPPKFNKPGKHFKKIFRGNCFTCGKPGHHSIVCKHRNKSMKYRTSKANLTEEDGVFVAIITKANLIGDSRDWVLDTKATRHIRGDRRLFASYKTMGDGEHVLMGDSHGALIVGKGNVMLKLTSGKTLALHDVMHVPKIHRNLVSTFLLNKVGMKMVIGANKIIISKNEVCIGKSCCNEGLFILSVNKNEYAYSSSAYITKSIDMRHGRLGHVNVGYIKKYEKPRIDS